MDKMSIEELLSDYILNYETKNYNKGYVIKQTILARYADKDKQIAELTGRLESSEQIRTAEKKILIEEIEKNKVLTTENELYKTGYAYTKMQEEVKDLQAEVDRLNNLLALTTGK